MNEISSRHAEYAAWIASYVKRHQGYVRGKCREAVTEMRLAFPELRAAAGFAHTTWGEDQHWWAVAPDGLIVDPTAAQFPCVDYEELDLNNPEHVARIPTGKCMECGAPTFRTSPSSMACSAECERALEAAYR